MLCNMVYALPFPRGCDVVGYGYQENYLVLNEKGGQGFYMILNRSNAFIELEHIETKEVFMSPKLHTKLAPSRWAAFAADVDNLYFKCFIQDGEQTTALNCKDVLDVCQYPRAKFALSNMGSYWVSTNKEQRQVIRDAAAKGIYLKW